jgi:hypothetical protein
MAGTRVPLNYPWALGVNKKGMYNKKCLPIFNDRQGKACSVNNLVKKDGMLWYLPDVQKVEIPSYNQVGDPKWTTKQGSNEFEGNWFKWVHDLTFHTGHIYEFAHKSDLPTVTEFIYPNTIITRDSVRVSFVTVTPIDMYNSRLTWSLSFSESPFSWEVPEDDEDNTFVCL